MPMPVSASHLPRNPFDLQDTAAYQAWRDWKLARYPQDLGELVVELRNPLQLRPVERQAIRERCDRANMALYACSGSDLHNRAIPLTLGRQMGLGRLDHNYLSDYDGLTSLTVADDEVHSHYIPYTNRAIKWHTDGYYNGPHGQIHGLLLHCARRAQHGGENALLDHEIAYILLREQDPSHIHALMQPDVMAIPARMEDGQVARRDQSGPVFSVTMDGHLHMRYTARSRNIRWKDDAATRAAVSALQGLLTEPSAYIFHGLLEPGMGLISNNVLHDRAAFSDTPDNPRLLYRARYYDRIPDTGHWPLD